MSKLAFKPKMGFLHESGEEKYRLFLKQHILDLNPKYYVVVHSRETITPDGGMYAIRLSTDIEHPGFEPIAEAWINGQYIYLWRGHCWGVAVDKDDKQILRYDNHPLNPLNHSVYIGKTVLIFKIGIDTV